MVTETPQSTRNKRVAGRATDGSSVVRLVSYSDAASYLGVSYWTVRSMVMNGQLPHVRAGRRVLIDVVDLDEWIEANKEVWA
jgi:excisionase family DNA binding protein